MSAPRPDWFLRPLVSVASGLIPLAIATWMFSIGEAPTAAFFLVLAVLEIPKSSAKLAIRRRILGDRRPFMTQPVFRYEARIFAAAGGAFLGVAFWSRAVGGDILFSQIGAFAMAAACIAVALFLAVVRLGARRSARKMADNAPTR